MNTTTTRIVLDLEPIMAECWNCKTREIRVNTAFGDVCCECEAELNALPSVDILTDGNTGDTTIDGNVWSITPVITEMGNIGVEMVYEY